ncbi:hypothetical protein [Effusibacillus consociatus]|uniref:DUF3139 domain-containing protein n=1 Tax=Effusibacillus consociatus TaxID=1117041 RepID=A0ABV9Q627_9BACL
MKKYKLYVLFVIIILGSFLFYMFNYKSNMVTVTENVKLIQKQKLEVNNNQVEYWIETEDQNNGRKKVLVNNISIWSLLKVNERYTITYEIGKDGTPNLISVFPSDYTGPLQ